MTVETTVIVQHGYSMSGAKTYGTSKDVFTKAKPYRLETPRRARRDNW